MTLCLAQGFAIALIAFVNLAVSAAMEPASSPSPPPASPPRSDDGSPTPDSPSKREYLLAQIRQKDVIIEKLLREVRAIIYLSLDDV